MVRFMLGFEKVFLTVHTKCFTLNNTYRFLKKKNKLKEKNRYLKSKVSKQKKTYKNFGKL